MERTCDICGKWGYTNDAWRYSKKDVPDLAADNPVEENDYYILHACPNCEAAYTHAQHVREITEEYPPKTAEWLLGVLEDCCSLGDKIKKNK